MPLVFAGVGSHAPGITGRAARADAGQRERFYGAYDKARQAMEAARPDVLVIVGAEHFANFFMNNMPAYAMGMADYYEGPIEDPDWLAIQPVRIPGNRNLSERLIRNIMHDVDLAYCEEWKFDHGIMVPLNFMTPQYKLPVIPVNINCQGPPLTPLHRAYKFGQALRRACDAVPERVAVIGTGGISHWPCTPNSGKINADWDRDFLEKWKANKKEDLLAYTDIDTYKDAGQGGFEIRTFIAISGLCEGVTGEVWCYEAIPIYAVGCTVGVMNIGATADKPKVLQPAE